MQSNLYLPEGTFVVIRDIVEVSKTAIIVDTKPIKENTGIIVLASKEVEKFLGCKVTFRENFYEEIKMTIEGKVQNVLFFRDLNSSIYYVNTDKG